MITKGTKEYKEAQELANKLSEYANTERYNNNSFFNIAFNDLASFISKIKSLNVFASNIATTVDNGMNPYGFKVANLSSKQAWILACAGIENGISF